MNILRSCLFLALVCTLGCGGGNKPVEAVKTTQNETPKTEPVKNETPTSNEKPAGPSMWKVTGDTITTASGLQYVVLIPGTGPSPKPGDIVQVHYSGWFPDGKKFDSSLDRGTPFEFPLGQKRVIAGWDEGVALMKQGGKTQFIIPGKLAYGDRGYPGVIPPNATLIFDVELLGMQPSK